MIDELTCLYFLHSWHKRTPTRENRSMDRRQRQWFYTTWWGWYHWAWIDHGYCEGFIYLWSYVLCLYCPPWPKGFWTRRRRKEFTYRPLSSTPVKITTVLLTLFCCRPLTKTVQSWNPTCWRTEPNLYSYSTLQLLLLPVHIDRFRRVPDLGGWNCRAMTCYQQEHEAATCH